MSTTPHPEIASREQWLTQRKELLTKEKQLTVQKDATNAQRRRLPMVRLEKQYIFTGAEGECSLLDLFQGQQQLIIYHFMFDPTWDAGCSGCTSLVNSFGDLSMLAKRDTSLSLVSRAPLPKLADYQSRQGWTIPWVSSYGSDFNYDFHVTQDPQIVPLQYNFRTSEEMQQRKEAEPYFMVGETHGMSVFFRLEDQVYHSYSTYARGCESVTDAYSLLDLTPYGRQEDFEDSPAGWPQRPTYG